MINFIPIYHSQFILFPLQTETIIVESEKDQVLMDLLFALQKPIGFIFQQKEFSTTAIIKSINKEHEQWQVELLGDQVIRVLELVAEIPEKPYQGAVVEYVNNSFYLNATGIEQLVLKEAINFFHYLNAVKKIDFSTKKSPSYAMANYCGMSLDEQYCMLQLTDEAQRLEWIRRHLKRVLSENADNSGLLMWNDLN